MLMLGEFLDGLQSQTEGFAIGRHAFVAIAIVQIFVEPLVNLRSDRYFVRFVPVVLWNDTVADRFQEARLPPDLKYRISGTLLTRSRITSRVFASQNFCWRAC